MERREWDLNPRGLRPTIFKTVPFGRSGIPPGQQATRLPRQGEAGDHGQDGEGDSEEGATFTPSADSAANGDEDAEGQGENQRRGEHVEHIGTKGTNL